MKFKITVVFVLWLFITRSQTVLNVHLNDWQNKPISFAIIKYKGTAFTSDEAGFFRISHYQPGSTLSIYKFGFADTTVSAAGTSVKPDTLSLFIVLRLKPTVLPEISVSSAVMEEINPLKAAFVLDYELKGEDLVELLSDDIVLVTNAENKISYRSRPVKGATNLVKDPYGTIHITTGKSAFKLFPKGSSTRLDSVPVDLAKLNWNIQYCDEVTDTSIFIRRYKDNNQTMAIFAVSALHGNVVSQLKEISDVEKKRAVAAFANETNSFNHYVASLGLTRGTAATTAEIALVEEAERMVNMLDMHYTLPSYSFLKLVNDSIYLFAHDIDSLFVYDQGWNLVKSKRITYHHLKIWGKELIVNEEKTKVYARLTENSKPVLAEIDLQTGNLKPVFTTINTKFPRKLKIRNNIVYFMAKQKGGSGYTVYSQNLQVGH